MTTSIADRLVTLNLLRTAAGKAPLASWKNSSAELDQRIADLTPNTLPNIKVEADATKGKITQENAAIIADALESGAKVTKVKTGVTKKVLDKKAAKAATKPDKPVTTKAAPKAKTTQSPNAFHELLAELGVDQKQARAKLRKAGMSKPYIDLDAIRNVLTKKKK